MASQSSPILNITDPTIRQPPPGQIRPYPSPTSTGKIPFPIPSHPDVHAETWYAVHGTLAPPGDADADADAPVPLIVLHGGPGAAHNYLKPLALLSLGPRAPRPVVLYDQVGCGRSARLRARRGDDGLWRPQLFVDELDNLVRHLGLRRFDLLGQSWGGMLAAQYAAAAAAGPASGLRRLVICDSPADMATWVAVADGLRGLLPEGVQETLRRCEEAGETDGAEYEEAMLAFYKLFVCRVDPMPKEFVETLELLKEDDTVYYTMVSQVRRRRGGFASGSPPSKQLTSLAERPIRVPRHWKSQDVGHQA